MRNYQNNFDDAKDDPHDDETGKKGLEQQAMQSGPNCTKACWKAPPQTPNSQSKALWLWLRSDGIPLPYFTQSAAFSAQGKNKTPASPIRLDHQSSTSHLRRNVKDRHFLKMITAFVIISACTRCHEKRREPAQPQRLRWQNRGLGGGAYQQAFAEVINSALLAALIPNSE